nr:hypothetical protein Q903MT_gene4764 [Picea sitchensis]
MNQINSASSKQTTEANHGMNRSMESRMETKPIIPLCVVPLLPNNNGRFNAFLPR